MCIFSLETTAHTISGEWFYWKRRVIHIELIGLDSVFMFKKSHETFNHYLAPYGTTAPIILCSTVPHNTMHHVQYSVLHTMHGPKAEESMNVRYSEKEDYYCLRVVKL